MREKITTYYPYLLFFVVSVFVTIVWFSGGHTLGGGESEIPFHNPNRAFDLFSSTWRGFSLGIVYTSSVSGLSLFVIPALLFSVGIPGSVSQALVFFAVQVIALISMYEVLKKLSGYKILALAGAFFYGYNLYTQLTWARFLYPSILMIAWVPLFFWLYLQFIEKRSIRYLLYMFPLTFLFSHIYIAPAHIITQFVPIIMYTIFLFIQRKWQVRVFVDLLVFGIVWALANVWWLVPLYLTSGTVQSLIQSASYSFDSLRGVSEYLTGDWIVRLANGFYMTQVPLWEGLYETRLHQALMLFPIAAFLIGVLIVIKARVLRSVALFFGVLTIISIVLAMGTNTTVGTQLYDWLFFSASILYRTP